MGNRLNIILILFFLFQVFMGYGQERRTSVLAEGRWFKLAITRNGIYKIDRSQLTEMGLNPTSVDPREIRIYGNGGKMLPQPNQSSRPADLIENAIWISGEDDGRFDTDDYILFYGQDPDIITFDTENNTIDYLNHSYSDTTFYFLTADLGPGKRITQVENVGNSSPLIDSFIDYQVYEKDLNYLLAPGSGREWYEAVFGSSTKTRDFIFEFPDIITSKPVTLKSFVLARSQNLSTITASINNTKVGNHEIGSVPGTQYSSRARESIELFNVNEVQDLGNDIKVTLDYTGDGTGYLNYLLISAYRSLSFNDSVVFFQNWESLDNELNTYSIQANNPNTLIWDITDPYNIFEQSYDRDGNNIIFGAESNELHHYAMFDPDKLRSPIFKKEISNQNLQGTVSANLIIVTHPLFLSEANRLADLRRTHDNMSVAVVEIEQIYNEFSSGAQDITAIRDFLKYLWDIDHSSTGLQNVLLFGKCSFDFKDRLPNNSNFVPTYESYNSLHPIFSYSSDDYFGFMEADEGEWRETGNGDHTMDIGVGRIPVTNLQDAKTVIDKYYSYALDVNSLGPWKNTITFVADDEDNNLHQRQADRLADTVERFDIVFNKKKIYLDAFKQEAIPGGETSSQTYNYLKKTIDNGTFIVNFTGHGGERQWTDERILDFIMIEQWENEYKLPIFLTATCEFGRHDTPEIISGAEKTLLRAKGGAIALVTTARPVFATQNFELNSAFYHALFNSPNGRLSTLGEVFKETKNNSLSGSVNRNFSLLGDPSLRLAIPEMNVKVDSLTSESGKRLDTLKALSKVKIRGSIRDDLGNVINGFSGQVDIIFFEKPSIKSTLGSKDAPFIYEERDNIIFKGKASVIEGHFQSEFIVPKNISYQYGKGKFSFYAFSRELIKDARGGSIDYIIGGSTTSTISDTTPPDISVFMGDSTFISGGTIKPNTLLVARISDESGINISQSGLGQGIQAILDNSVTFDLNEYYESDLDTYKSGWLHYPIENLETGPHTITVKVWDAFNNPSEAFVDFVVSENGALSLNNLRNYPNPFSELTKFKFEHNRPGEDLETSLLIYNAKGEIVKKFDHIVDNSLVQSSGIEWDGRNSSGSKVQPGIYFYRVIVRSNSDGASNQLYQKLIIY